MCDHLRKKVINTLRRFEFLHKMSGVVNVFVSSPDTYSERRIEPHITVGQLKVISHFDTAFNFITYCHDTGKIRVDHRNTCLKSICLNTSVSKRCSSVGTVDG